MEIPDFPAGAEERINGEKREKFRLFREILLEYNRKYNLTSITDEREIFYKHFLDSAAGAFLFPSGANVAEVGSGAGFPSLVLKILREDLSFTLFESVGKKCDFLRVAVDNLGLSGVNIMQMRAEDAAGEEKFREKFDFCTARAVARMNTLCEYCLPLVRVGGAFVAYKSGDMAEIGEAEKAVRLLGGERAEIYEYELPEGFGSPESICNTSRPTQPPMARKDVIPLRVNSETPRSPSGASKSPSPKSPSASASAPPPKEKSISTI